MSVANFFSVEPCFDDKEGANDYSLMERIGLPGKWIAMVKAMEARGITWIGVREYYWTPDDWFPGMPIPDDQLSEIQRKSRGVFFQPMDKDLLAEIRRKTGGCFYSLTLTDQASVLSVPLLCLQASRKRISNKQVWCLGGETFDRVEDAALVLLGREGWQGLADEGTAAHVIVSLVVRAIERDTRERIYGLLPDDRAFRDPDAHWQAIDEYIGTRLDDDWICRALHTDSDWAARALHNKGTIASMKAVWNGLGAAFFRRLVAHRLKLKGGLSGWPDLTLWKGAAVRFVEVKHNDKLHRNQAYWIRNFARPMDLDVSVLRFRVT
jgi:hypothetical protein